MPASASTPTPLMDPILQLADAMPQLVWIADADGVVTYFNIRVQEYSGPRRSRDGTWEWIAMIHPDDAGETALKWQHSIVTGQNYEAENRMCLADGTYAWHLTRGLPQKGPDEKIVCWIGTSTNIDDHKRSEKILRESEERFRLLTNSIPQIVWVVDAQENTEYVNDRWESYTGQSMEKGSRSSRIEMIHPDDLPLVLDTWAIALKSGDPTQWEYRLRNAHTDRYRWFAAHVLPLKDEQGVVRKWICAATDIQSHKDTNGDLGQLVQERTLELAQVNEMLRKQAGELQRSNEDLQQFAHVASHDLKEPVRKIRTFGNRLTKEFGPVLPERAREFLTRIESSAERMSQMIDGVLHYSLIDSMEYNLIPVDLNVVLQQVAVDLELVIQKKEAIVEWDTLPSVAGIPLLVQQLFFNLVHNALKFTVPGAQPRVTVTVRKATLPEVRRAGLPQAGGFQAIRVTDDGIGFDNAFAKNIFKTFTRLHSKDAYEGTGLGLALCNKIIQRHGGAIHAKSSVGEGATFTVYLPICQADSFDTN